MVVVAMTSNPTQTEWSFVVSPDDIADGRLNRPGTIRADKIYTLAQSLAVVRFGRVSGGVLARIRSVIIDLTRVSS